MHQRFTLFVDKMNCLVQGARGNEEAILTGGSELLKELVKRDDWLPDEFAQPHPDHYQQYLLYCAPDKSFSVVSFVWGPGQATPIHDHTVWGLIGMLRGSEIEESFSIAGEGHPMKKEGETRLDPGMTGMVSPTIGDIHRVSNAYDNRVSISIHVYGADIGQVKRHVIDEQTGAIKSFISGYANRQ